MRGDMGTLPRNFSQRTGSSATAIGHSRNQSKHRTAPRRYDIHLHGLGFPC